MNEVSLSLPPFIIGRFAEENMKMREHSRTGRGRGVVWVRAKKNAGSGGVSEPSRHGENHMGHFGTQKQAGPAMSAGPAMAVQPMSASKPSPADVSQTPGLSSAFRMETFPSSTSMA